MPKKTVFGIASHCNMFDDCLKTIKNMGFKLEMEECATSPTQVCYRAKKVEQFGVYQLAADNPIELLGLATLAVNAKHNPDDPWWGYVKGSVSTHDKLLKKMKSQWSE